MMGVCGMTELAKLTDKMCDGSSKCSVPLGLVKIGGCVCVEEQPSSEPYLRSCDSRSSGMAGEETQACLVNCLDRQCFWDRSEQALTWLGRKLKRVL